MKNLSNNHNKYFLYARKSSEAEDRQVLSVEAQVDELKAQATSGDLEIVEILREAQSAKKPGRPIFNTMLERIQNGEAQGILCWKLDRLARNPIDGGQIQWMLQQGLIQHIHTYERSYFPTDNVLMMSVELGMANQFIRDLSTNVKRGFRKKRERGEITGVAPSGYLNTPDREKGTKVIIRDPERFLLVRKMWDLMLTGNYTVMQILDIANNQWGYRTIKRRNSGGRPLARSSLYKMFTSTFYYAEMEYPKGSGQYYKGSHEPMVSKEEFDLVQIFLGKKGKHRPHHRTFAFTGLIRCGDCGAQITAEEKHQIICSNCKHKFGYENKSCCPKCNTSMEKMKNPKILHYTYYHCTKRKSVKCTQGSVKLEELETQIAEYLGGISINQKYLDWALVHLREKNEKEAKVDGLVIHNHQEAYNQAAAKLDELLEMRLAKEIGAEEFAEKKQKLLAEKKKYQDLMANTDNKQNNRVDRSEKFFEFCYRAKIEFEIAKEKKNYQKQREILATLGSNLSLKDKKLNITPLDPFTTLQKGLIKVPAAGAMFEPAFGAVNKKQNDQIRSDRLTWLGW